MALAIEVLSGPVTRSLALDLRGFLMNAHLVPPDAAGMTAAGRHALWAWLAAVALPLGVLLLAGLAGWVVQHRPLALRIRAVAAEHGVPLVDNPPLARALHATVDIDEEIPVEHYKAVAEVIGYVLRLRRRPA